MSDHDPMCISQSEPSFVRFCDCKRVAQIRADERNTVATKRTEMMEFKPGDRVKVEYEGVVAEGAGAYADLVLVRSVNGAMYLKPDAVTLLGPEEPTGVGAVVRDAEGLMYVRTPGKHADYQWSVLIGLSARDLASWGEVCENGPVEVLFEGVQP